MNRSKHICILLLIFLLMGCSSEPYEEQLTKFFEVNAKVVPIIEEVTIDSTATLESYKDYWKMEIANRREKSKKNAAESYEFWKKQYEEGVRQNKTDYLLYKKNFSDTALFASEMRKSLNKMDSVQYETGIIYDVYNELIDSKSNYEYLKVKYKISKDGPTLIQSFVVENNVSVYSTNLSLDNFIKEIVFENIRVKKVEENQKNNPSS